MRDGAATRLHRNATALMALIQTFGNAVIRLSGGQRQRIGLARALYHRPSLLSGSKASSLPKQSGQGVCSLAGKLTMVWPLIASVLWRIAIN